MNNEFAVEFFNPSTLTARQKLVSELGRGTIFLPFNHQLLLTPDLKVHAIGGGGNCFSFGTHLNGDVVSFDLVKAVQALASGSDSKGRAGSDGGSIDSSPSPVLSRRSSGPRVSGGGGGRESKTKEKGSSSVQGDGNGKKSSSGGCVIA